MGCLESRDKKNYEQIFNEIDFRLKFNYLSLETLKNAFFGVKNKKITYNEMISCLSKANIKYNKPEEFTHLRNFLEIFKLSSDLEFEFYDFSRILLLMVLFCKDKICLKLELIFDFFDEDKDGILSKNEVRYFYLYVLQTVSQYSSEILLYEKHLEKDSQLYAILIKNTNDSIDVMMGDFVEYVMKGNENVARRKFIGHVKKFSLDENILDFSSPKEIRKAIMPGILRAHAIKLPI